MASTWDARDDFAVVLDTLEPLTLHRQGGEAAGESLQGWRYREKHTDPYGAEGGVRLTDTTWHLPNISGDDPPRPGDILRDESSACATIREVSRLRGQTRYVCTSRLVELSPLKAEHLAVESPVFGNPGVPDEVTGWAVTRPRVVAWVDRIDSDHASAIEADEPIQLTAYFVRPFSIQIGERLLSEQDEVLSVVSVAGQAGLGDPFVVGLELGSSE